MPHCRKIACADSASLIRDLMQDMKSGPPCDTRRTQQTAAVAPRYAGGGSQEKRLGYTLRNCPCIHGRHATHGADPGPQWTRGTPRASLQRAEQIRVQIAEEGARDRAAAAANPASVNIIGGQLKWLIKASAEG